MSSLWRFQARMLELWDEGDPSWFASRERPEGRPWDEVALEALEAALDPLEERFGRDPGRLALGPGPRRRVRPPVRRREPPFPTASSTAPVETGGASETVTQNGYLATAPFKGVWGPVYRMLADLGDARARAGSSRPASPATPARATTTTCSRAGASGTHQPGLLDEHELRAAGGARQLRLDPDY